MTKIDKKKLFDWIEEIGFNFNNYDDFKEEIAKIRNILINEFNEEDTDLLILYTNKFGSNDAELRNIFIKNVSDYNNVIKYVNNVRDGSNIIKTILQYKLDTNKFDYDFFNILIHKYFIFNRIPITYNNILKYFDDIIHSYDMYFYDYDDNKFNIKNRESNLDFFELKKQLIYYYAKPDEVLEFLSSIKLNDKDKDYIREHAGYADIATLVKLYNKLFDNISVEALEKVFLEKNGKSPDSFYFNHGCCFSFKSFITHEGFNLNYLIDFAIDNYNAEGLLDLLEILFKLKLCDSNSDYFHRIENKIILLRDPYTSIKMLYKPYSNIKEHENVIRTKFYLCSNPKKAHRINQNMFINIANMSGTDFELYESIIIKFYPKFIIQFINEVPRANKIRLRDALLNENFKKYSLTRCNQEDIIANFISNVSGVNNFCLINHLLVNTLYPLDKLKEKINNSKILEYDLKSKYLNLIYYEEEKRRNDKRQLDVLKKIKKEIEGPTKIEKLLDDYKNRFSNIIESGNDEPSLKLTNKKTS